MALEEAAAWLDGDLILPIGGKKYRVPEYNAEIGLRVEAVLNAGNTLRGDGAVPERHRQLLSDEGEKNLYADVLGPAYEPLLTAVSWPMLKHCALTAMFHFNISPEYAEMYWARTVGKSPAGKATGRTSRPATRRTTAAAPTTRKPASGSGTRSRRSS